MTSPNPQFELQNPEIPVERIAATLREQDATEGRKRFLDACDRATEASRVREEAKQRDAAERKLMRREIRKWQSTAFVLGVALAMVTIAALFREVVAAGCSQ